MTQPPLLTNQQLEILLRHGPELDKIEPLLSPQLREVLVDLQRNAADQYASGEWHVAATGECFTVKATPEPPPVETAQAALGKAYLTIGQRVNAVVKIGDG